MREKTKENAFFGIWAEFCITASGGTDPDTATESSKGCEIVDIASCNGKGCGGLIP